MVLNTKTQKTWLWFAIFNFLAYTAVFLGRIMRDTLLFTAEGGDKLFPWVLVINAVLMTWFSSRLEAWWEHFGAKKIMAFAFIGSAAWFGVMAYLISHSLANSYLLAFFYLGSELPIFLGINLIWILAEDYFTEQQGQRDFPRISAIGQLGIILASGLIIIQGNFADILSLKSTDLLYFLAVINLLLWIFTLYLQSKITPIKTLDYDFELPPINETKATKTSGFFEQALKDYRWAKTEKFIWLFTLVTICNFILLAIFDQTLANGAVNLKTTATELSLLLAYWILGFGVFSAIFQWLVLPWLLDKLGVAKVNLAAPLFMLLGAVSYILFASDFLNPIWAKVDIDTSSHLLTFLLLARILGWIAEFVFNQSLLPLVYGILPSRVVNRGRFFVEGPVTAITNGVAGLFLIGYFFLFRVNSEASGYQLDLLFLLAVIAGVLMLIFSFQMLPEFRKTLLNRLKEGEQFDLNVYSNEFAEMELKGDSAQNLATTIQSNNDANIQAKSIDGLIKLNALAEFDHAWHFLTEKNNPPDLEVIDAMAKAAQHFGYLPSMLICFKKWLEVENCSEQVLAALFRHLADSGIDGALSIEKFLTEWEKNPNNQTNTSKVLIQLGSGRFYPKLRGYLRNEATTQQNIDWLKLAETNFLEHTDVLDAFALILGACSDAQSPPAEGLIKLVQRYPWLNWPMLYLLDMNRTDLPDNLAAVRFVWPLLLEQSIECHLDISSLTLFEKASTRINKNYAPELQNIQWQSQNKEPLSHHFEPYLKNHHFEYPQYLKRWLIKHPEPWEFGLVQNILQALYALLEKQQDIDLTELKPCLEPFYQSYLKIAALRCLFKDKCRLAEHWLKRRYQQSVQNYLILLCCFHPQSRDIFNPAQLATDLLSSNQATADKALSLLAEGINRKDFIRFRDEFNQLNDCFFASNSNKDIPFLPKGIPNAIIIDNAIDVWQEIIPLLGDRLLLDLTKGINNGNS